MTRGSSREPVAVRGSPASLDSIPQGDLLTETQKLIETAYRSGCTDARVLCGVCDQPELGERGSGGQGGAPCARFATSASSGTTIQSVDPADGNQARGCGSMACRLVRALAFAGYGSREVVTRCDDEV
jgi:hypothetical protein